MDVDTRLLRYFAVVAEEGNLTRAAERLFVSQPALTKQIKQLENMLSVRLFTRSRAGMALTEPGRILAEQVPALLEGWGRILRETKNAAGRTERVLRIGYLASAANEATQHIIAEFARLRPDWRAEMRQATWSTPAAGLASGDIDVALVRLPFPGQDDLRVEVLFAEPRWVALPTAHPLATREVISFPDLWDEPFVAAPAATGRWRDFWLATDERDGHPVRIGAVVEQPDDWLSAIANGYGIALAPRSAARFYARPGVTYRPVNGVSSSQVGVAWAPADDADPVIGDFVRCCLSSRSPHVGESDHYEDRQERGRGGA
ncbi:LysR family transcriptional regulator [Streptosporangium roseum]|uniref:Transcriptional regulator, LysR family n=1 Tax=Streptosporangium roseum (strain ATCC 12428 / DSM 43021 / JCM 3005 / KCTC 9067 / NCIMB 10171 / NRRL 2505 / NI 9100) TaxID=479432 RepID=D2B603_STRRD|nr:LysR family transcriptional regulator [Streptosporangium roseum]ACZ91457.1 transcriptional regulator, LysR family [Streptosporangium roseum DSM 43021]